MKAISIQQPWGWAILRAGKSPENRANKRGEEQARKQFAAAAGQTILIHTSQRYAGIEAFRQVQRLSPIEVVAPGVPGREPAWEFGAFVGVVTVVGVHTAGACEDPATGRLCTPWAEDHAAHLVIEDPRVLFRAIPYPGRLGLWEVEDSTVLAEVRRCLS